MSTLSALRQQSYQTPAQIQEGRSEHSRYTSSPESLATQGQQDRLPKQVSSGLTESDLLPRELSFLSDMQNIRKKVALFFKKRGKKTYKLVQDIDHETTQYFKGLFLTIVIQFFEYTLVFKLIGHPNFLLLGILCSVSTLIPYFGGMIVNIIAIMIASVVSPQLLILTIIVSLIFPNIDGYIISPRVYGKTNNISPLLTIFAVFAGGVLGGFVGILIALPLTIILKTIYKHYEDDIKEKIDDIKEAI